MWNLFEKKEWVDETFSAISGNAAELHVTIYNFPCRKAKGGSHYRYRYSNFGHEFITELSGKQLSDFESAATILNEGKVVRVPVRVKGLPEMAVEIQGRPGNKRVFYSDLADAIIDAMAKYNIKA